MAQTSTTYEPLAITPTANPIAGTVELRLTTAVGWVEGMVITEPAEAVRLALDIIAKAREVDPTL
jgi:hypothetical protein